MRDIHHKKNKFASGFTIIEMLIVMAIASVLLSAAVPSYQNQVKGSRMTAATTDLLSNLMAAKAESVGRNEYITVCMRNADATGCTTTGDWGQGWISFLDADGDGSFDVGDEVIQKHAPLAVNVSAIGTEQIEDFITFRPNGQTHFSGTQSLVICDDRGFGDKARAVVITIMGKAMIVPASESGQTNCLT
jgi:type IV fimbrial biogenesis protein FimT